MSPHPLCLILEEGGLILDYTCLYMGVLVGKLTKEEALTLALKVLMATTLEGQATRQQTIFSTNILGVPIVGKPSGIIEILEVIVELSVPILEAIASEEENLICEGGMAPVAEGPHYRPYCIFLLLLL